LAGRIQISREFGVPVCYQESGRPFDFDQSTAHELLMIVREALHNALRHGQPTQVEVSIAFEDKQFRMQVRDNGCGFDPAVALSSSNGHYGLVGIEERVKRVGGTLIINSRPGAGAELTLHLPREATAAEPASARNGLPRG
jgi:signal transduction histidine kinase